MNVICNCCVFLGLYCFFHFTLVPVTDMTDASNTQYLADLSNVMLGVFGVILNILFYSLAVFCKHEYNSI